MKSMKLSLVLSKSHLLSFIKYFAVVLSFSGLAIRYLTDPPREAFHQLVHSSPLFYLLIILGFCTMAFTALFFSWLAFHAFRYRPIDGVPDAMLPTVTVVVPAFNEGQLVQETLRSLANSDYPKEKLQLISIDDGSRDDTFQWIQKAKKEFPDRILALRLLRNSGKRKALYEGFIRATGDILVTVDSDSIVEANTLRNMVSPFVGDPDCGAVAGNVRVLNRNKMIPRMLDVSFVFAFEFVRSAQSVMRTVLCTPGALAAYRRDLVMKVIEEWLNQTFFGRKATIGEDRAITNLILRQGKSVLFQSNANVFTNVPDRYRNLCKMLIRWGRSNVRETLKMQSYVFTNFRSHHRTSARLLFFMQQWWCMFSTIMFLLTLAMTILFPFQIILTTVAGGALWSSLPALYYARNYSRREALWSYTYGIFHFAALAWIAPYAFMTMWRSGWLTRTLPQTTPQLPPVNLKETAKALLS